MPAGRGRASLRAAILTLLCLVLVAVRATAQTAIDGAIRGEVMDPSGAVIRGAVVTVRDPASAIIRRTSAGADGIFLLPRVAPGEYAITAEGAGFVTETLPHVVVALGEVTTVSIRLGVAGGPATIFVTPQEDPEAPSSTATVSGVGQSEMQQFPVADRRWQDFALLTPTANSDWQGDNQLSFRGLAVTANATSIDGASGDQRFSGVPRGTSGETTEEDSAEERRDGVGWNAGARRHSGATYTFSQEAVREFRIGSQNQSALYGHGAGGIITTITRSGTKDLHATAFYHMRSSALAAANPFSIAVRYNNGLPVSTLVKPHDLRQQWGGSVGGAARRDRLFYFYALDQQRRGFPAISSPADPAFYSLTATQSALLANRGVSAAKIDTALRYLDSLTGTVDRRSSQSINFGKLDWNANEKHRLSLQGNFLRSSSPRGLRSAPVVDRGVASLGSATVDVDAASARWLWIGSARLTHELRFSWGRELQYQQPEAPLAQEPAVGPGGYAPEVAIGPNGFTFGTPASLGRSAWPDERRVEIGDLVSWQRGHHLVQAGFEVSFVHERIDSLNNIEGTFHYDSGTTSGHAGGLVDWITDYTFNVNAYPNGGCPSIHAATHYFCFRSYTQSFGEAETAFDTQEWAAFVEDSWHATRRLTLHAGLRYEYQLLPFPQQPNAALDATFGTRGATSVFPEDRNNLGPRVGLAWEPFGKKGGTVRAAYGVYYGMLPGATIQAALVNTAIPSSTTHIRIVPSTITSCPQVANQGFGYACSYVSTPPAAVGQTTAATVFDRRFRLPMVQQATLSMERELGKGITASATYLANLDRQLPSSVDINTAPSADTKTFQIAGGNGAAGVIDGEIFALPVYTSRISASYGPVSDLLSSSNASYNALSLEARRRGRKGLQFFGSFTWAKAIDYGQGTSIPRTNSQLDPFTNAYDKALSRLNVPHKIVIGTVWEPRLHLTEIWMRHAANGWSVAGVFMEHSGRPYSYEIFGGTRLTGGRESINGSGGAVYLPTVGRNTLRLPDTANLNLRLSRRFSITERVHARAQAEVFNVANHVNYTGINQRAFLVGTAVNGVTPLVFQDAATVAAEGLNTTPFGTYTAASTGVSSERQVQLGLRVEF
jgi:hypothetical protein